MKINRDILGTVVAIELTEEEITKAHIAYLEQEIKSLKGRSLAVSAKEPDTNSLMPDTEEPDYMIKLRECDRKLRSTRKDSTTFRRDILDAYIEYIFKAFCNGMTLTNLSTILGVKYQTVESHLRKYRERRAICAA